MTTQPADRDARTHATACTQPTTGSAWTDRCRCRHIRLRHDAASHAPINVRRPDARQVTCTGRNNAGDCLDCDCAAFDAAVTAPTEKEEPPPHGTAELPSRATVPYAA